MYEAQLLIDVKQNEPKTMLNTAAGASWGDVDCCVIVEGVRN